MSRTYRRKNGWDNPTYDFSYEINGFVQKIYYSKNSKEYHLAQVKYHRDNSNYRKSAPHWFVNLFCERKLRQQSKQELKKWLKNPNEIEPMVPLFIRDAGWKYW